MIRRMLNKCTTAVTLNLDGNDVTIPAGEMSPEYKTVKFSFADQRLINACLLVPIESKPRIPMKEPSDNDLRQPRPKKAVENGPNCNPDGSAKTDKKTKSKTDK